MADAFKVRLEDGTEYGPVDVDTLRLWYDEGRISKKTLVLRPEGAWSMLSEILGLGAPRPAEPPPAGPAAAGAATGQAKAGGPTPTRSGASRPRPQPMPRPEPSGPPLAAIAIAFVALLAIIASVGWWAIGRRTPSTPEDAIKEWASPERRFADAALGVTLQAPEGWVILRKGNPFVLVSNTLVALAHPKTGGFAVLTMDSVLKRNSVDETLDALIESRRGSAPGISEEARSDATVSGQKARRTTAAWSAEGSKQRAVMVAWQDAWNYFALTGWCPEPASADFDRALQGLQGAITATPVITARIQQAVPEVMDEVPQLTPAAAELLVRAVLSRGGNVESVAQEAFYAASKGHVALSLEEAKEMGKILNEQVYKPIPKDQRAALASYLERVSAGRSSQKEEDRGMRDQIKAGVLALPDDTRKRLQVLWERTVIAALKPS
jgi:hypothetical protein